MFRILIFLFVLSSHGMQVVSSADVGCDLNCTLECPPPTTCVLISTCGCPNATCHLPRLDFPVSPPPDENSTPPV